MTWRSISQWFSSVAESAPAQVAIEWRDVRLTYGDLHRRVRSLARRLRQQHPAKGARVGVLSESRLDDIIALLAALQAGHVFMAIDRTLPLARLQRMMAVGNPDLLIAASDEASRALARSLCECSPASHAPHVIAFEGSAAAAAAAVVAADEPDEPDEPDESDESDAPIAQDALPDDPAYLCFSSGSTGDPKGILGRLAAIDHFIRWEIEMLPAPAGVRVSQLTHPGFDAFLRDVFVPLCTGGVICIPDEPSVMADASRLAEWLDRAQVRVMHCVPSVFRALLGTPLDNDCLRSLRHVLLAGERVLPVDVERWMEIFGQRIEVINLYGPSETTMTKLFHRISADDVRRRRIPIGKPLPDTTLAIVDEAGQPCVRGAVGELLIATPYASLGYVGDAEATRRAFVPNPIAGAHDVAYRTGDLVRMLADESIEFIGRRDAQVKIRGVRVEPGEVEELLRRAPGVRDAAVVGHESDAGEISLIAGVVGVDLQVDALRRQLDASLPAAAVPSAILVLDALPRTPNGKVDRRRLAALAAEAPRQRPPARLPASAAEREAASVWARVLNLSQVDVDVDEDFFAAGGHSLMATRLLAGLRAELGVSVKLAEFLKAPTCATLARHVEAARRAAVPPMSASQSQSSGGAS